jgi:hypothetical protein
LIKVPRFLPHASLANPAPINKTLWLKPELINPLNTNAVSFVKLISCLVMPGSFLNLNPSFLVSSGLAKLAPTMGILYLNPQLAVLLHIDVVMILIEFVFSVS